MKTKIKILIGAVIIFLCFLNLNVIVNRDNESKLSLSSILSISHAEGEGTGQKWLYFCNRCFDHYGQPAVYYTCQPSDIADCFYYPCFYGVC